MDQKLRVARGVLSALAHYHASGVRHRAVSPATLVVGLDGQTRLLDFDFARPGPPRERTLARELPEVVEPAFWQRGKMNDEKRTAHLKELEAKMRSANEQMAIKMMRYIHGKTQTPELRYDRRRRAGGAGKFKGR